MALCLILAVSGASKKPSGDTAPFPLRWSFAGGELPVGVTCRNLSFSAAPSKFPSRSGITFTAEEQPGSLLFPLEHPRTDAQELVVTWACTPSSPREVPTLSLAEKPGHRESVVPLPCRSTLAVQEDSIPWKQLCRPRQRRETPYLELRVPPGQELFLRSITLR